MSAATTPDPMTMRPFERTVPPVIPVAMVALALAVTGGVFLSAEALTNPSLVVPAIFVIAGAVLELAAVVLALRTRPFAWRRFRMVFGWALLAYVVQSAMIVFAFARNHVPGGPMALLVIGVAVFATDVPLMIGYTVARYQRPSED